MMTSQQPDVLVKNYLNSVRRAIAPLPGKQRQQLVDELTEHIAAARLELADDTDVAVLDIIDRLGTPASIASAAAREGSPASTMGQAGSAREIWAIGLLLFGALLFGFGWLVGVYLLWESPAWSRREKLLGTLVLPGGLAGSLFFAPVVLMVTGSGAWNGTSSFGWLVLSLPLVTCTFLVIRRRRYHQVLLDV